MALANLSFNIENTVGNLAKNIAAGGQKLLNEAGKIISPISLPDGKSVTDILQTHSGGDVSFDEDSLFVIVNNILNRATQIIDGFVQGTNDQGENTEEKVPKGDFKPPLCTIRSIANELTCKQPGQEFDTALSILKKLSNYKWEAKAVLTLAAFVYDVWDFWHYAQQFYWDSLAVEYGTLKHVPKLIKAGRLQIQYQQPIRQLNELIKVTADVIAKFDELEKFYHAYDPEVSTEYDLRVNVYWTIVTIAASATKFSILTGDEPEKPFDLKRYDNIIHTILNEINEHLDVARKQREEEEDFRHIKNVFRKPSEVIEVFQSLIFTRVDVSVQNLIVGSTNDTVKIDVLKGHELFLYFSIDITIGDVEQLKPIYDRITQKEEKYKIVWVPVVEKWTEELEKKFEALRPKIPWLVVKQVSRAGIRFIKQIWEFKGKPSLVQINTEGTVENTNVFQTIATWGLELLFDKQRQKDIKEANIPSIVGNITEDSHLKTWIKEEKFIFIYGGEEIDLVQQLTKKLSSFKDTLKIDIELSLLEKPSKGGEGSSVVEKVWSGIQDLLIKRAKKSQFDDVTQDIVKLLSFRTKAWAVLSKGSTVITTGYGTAILKVVEDLDKWKEAVKKKEFSFAATFKELYSHVPKEFLPHYYQFDLPISVNLKCPDSNHFFDTHVTYKCFPTIASSSSVPNAH